MCEFFSFVTDRDYKVYYFDKEQRKKNVLDTNDQREYDSHSIICNYYYLNCDEVNKYEYDVVKNEIRVDQLNCNKVIEKEKLLKIITKINPVSFCDSKTAYYYCRDVKNTREMRDKITDSQYAYLYCIDIKNTKKIRDRITDDRYIHLFCRYVKNTKEMRDRIIDSRYAYH